jgi:mannosylglycerate hydrolase
MITYHVIPHTHWDREWYLSFDHFRVMLVHMMDDLLDIVEARDDYAGFLLDGQTVVAEDYLEVRPERRDVLARLVREKRLFMGPWYVLPDLFLVSGESIVRNLIRGRATARSFGGSMNVGYVPDSFGHIAQMPQILRGFGIDTAIVWRGFGGEPGQEGSEYRWHAPDGSVVLMEHLSGLGYSGAYFDAHSDGPAAEERLAQFRRHVDARSRTTERLMLSGGDHHWPVAGLPDAIAHLNGTLGEDARMKHSSLDAFVEALKSASEHADLPDVVGELRFGYRWAFNVTGGVYSSRMYLKQANANGQRRLERHLEPLNVLAVRAGARSQKPLLDTGWRYLLLNHPHDSICGCSIDIVHREMVSRFEKLDELAGGVERFAWLALVPDAEGEAGDDQTLVFFNPSPFKRDAVVEWAIDFYRQQVVVGLNPDVVPGPPQPPVTGFAVLASDGSEIPCEVLDHKIDFALAMSRYDYPAQSRVERFQVRMLLENMPPLGLRTLQIVRRGHFPQATAGELEMTDTRTIQHAFLRVTASDDGSFTVKDRETGLSFGPLGYFEDGADAGDTYNYSPPPEDDVRRSGDADRIEVEVVPGALRIGLRVRGAWHLPRGLTADLQRRSPEETIVPFTTTAYLTAGDRHVTFETEIDNTAEDHRLRVLFESGRNTNVHRADSAFAVIERRQESYNPGDFDIEVPAAVSPMQRFVTIEDEAGGATILADGLPEYELVHDSGGIVALTLLRCVGELAREGLLKRPGGQSGWRNATPEAQCPGRHTFRYAFLPHGAGWPEPLGRIQKACDMLLIPPSGTSSPALRDSASDYPFLSVEPPALALSALKEAEDGTGLTVRIYNPGPDPIDGVILLHDPPAEIRRADLEERPGDSIAAPGAVLRDHWPPFTIRTYRFYYQTTDVARPSGGKPT